MGTAIAILYVIMLLYELPLEQIVGVSALLGAIVSFASLQTIQNFIAGIFILITRLFGIEDYVSVGSVEGVVKEITLNYTKLLTVDGPYHFIPNKKILNATIINYNRKVKTETEEGLEEKLIFILDLFEEDEIVRYSFQWGAPLGSLKATKSKLEEVCQKYEYKFGFKPSFFLFSIAHRMEFKFIVKTTTADKILEHITDFRDDIVGQFH